VRDARLRAAAEATGQVAWAITPEGEMVEESPSWCGFTGQSPEDARGRGWLDALHPDDRGSAERAWIDASSQRRTFSIEYRVRRPGGRYTRARARSVPVLDSRGSLRQWIVSSTEVWTDESVRRSEERLRLATEAANVAIWEYDFVAGQMTRTENHDGLYGLGPQPVWTYDIFTNATHPDDRVMADQTVQAAVEPGGPDDYAFDFRTVWPDGTTHWLAVSGHVFARDGAGRATLVRGALIDVTRLKNVEAELREAIRVRDEFLQIASHELNTPLTSLALQISSMHRLAERGQLRSEDLPPLLSAARRQVRRLSELSRDLLDVTRLAQGPTQLSRSGVSLSEVARAVADVFAAQVQREGGRLDLTLAEDVIGQWDRARIEQVIENLLGNALKYGRGKPVQLEVSRTETHGRIVVRDQGVGIEPEALPRIFQKFERAGSASGFGGLGLGLFIAREIVEGHGGTIRAISEPGEGATFVVELPLREGGGC
jgi:PAS domain S-box-containing protein